MKGSGVGLNWLLFVLLGFFWGSSYLFIKIGVEAGLQPFTLVSYRLAIGLVLLASVVAISRERLPRHAATYGHLLVIGVLSVALPFSLITWAEQDVDSALAAVINAAIPLFVIVIAAATLPDEPFTGSRLAGLLIGFAGVAIIVGFDPGVLGGSAILPVLALLGSTASYAAGGVYARRFLSGVRPQINALFEVAFALVMVAALALLLDGSISMPDRADAWLAVVWLGLLGSGFAFLIFFRLLSQWGATRTSLVAYLLPIFGIVLGAAVLGEPVGPRLVVGTALILGGIALVNVRPGSIRLRLPRPT